MPAGEGAAGIRIFLHTGSIPRARQALRKSGEN
jgi:hypothetical protein